MSEKANSFKKFDPADHLNTPEECVAYLAEFNGDSVDLIRSGVLDVVRAVQRMVLDGLAAPAQEAPGATEIAEALERMDALLDPKNKLLTVGDQSATVKASRADMALIRAALAAAPQAPAAPCGTDEVTCVCGATWERHSHCDYEMVHTPRKAAPAASAVDASDTALLDAMERHRIAVVPEFDGPWDAELYGEGAEPLHVGSGATPREALRAALAAQAKEDGGAA